MSHSTPLIHDPLTGLHSRAWFIERLEAAVAGGGEGDWGALMLLDLDRFAHVNDTLGPHAADELLQAAAGRLRRAIGPGGALARWVGDQFAVLCPGPPDHRAATALAEDLLGALRTPFVVDDRAIHQSARIGIVLSDGGHPTADALIRDAGVALHRAKADGGSRWRVFEPSMRTRAVQRMTLEHDLRGAVDRDEIVVFFQPTVSLAERRIVGLETLVRWQHPRLGLLAAADFVPIAEETGLIVDLGRWVLEEACRRLARWSATCMDEVPIVSVNVAGRQLAQPGFAADVAAILRRTGVPADHLAFEFSERVLVDESSAAVLGQLHDLGVLLILDDFGAGQSSLSSLKRFPIATLKVDGSFVSAITESEQDRHIFRAIVELGAAIGVHVIAAGVETGEQAACASELGCAMFQGYHFAVPIHGDGVPALLQVGVPPERLELPVRPEPASLRAVPGRPAAGEPAGITVALGEAADALGVSTSTLRRWADSGRIASIRTAGGHRRFALTDIRSARGQGILTAGPVLRDVMLPTEPLPALAELLEGAGTELAQAAVRALYEAPRQGWFAGDEGEAALLAWSASVAGGAREVDHARSLDATRRLLRQAEMGGASLLERHTLLARYSDLVVRALTRREARHADIVGARRVFTRLCEVPLMDAEQAQASAAARPETRGERPAA